MNWKKWLICAVVALMLVGCGAPTIDGSSREAMQESVQNIMKSLPDEKARKFRHALGVLAMRKFGQAMASAFARASGEPVNKDRKTLMEMLDGKTAEEVIAMAGTGG